MRWHLGTTDRGRRCRRCCRVLRNVDCDLVRLDFIDPDGDDDVLLAFEAEFVTYWSHSEIVRDALIDALLQSFQPEYESMIEVEIVDD